MKCQSCGNEVKEGAKFCRECGSEIVYKTESFVDNICSECGNVLEENAVFCNNCGKRVASQPEAIIENTVCCPKCGSKLRDGVMFCGECGTPLNSNNKNDSQPLKSNNAPKKKDKSMIFLISLLIVVIIGCAAVIGYVYYQNNSININTPSIESDIDEKSPNEEAENEESIEHKESDSQVVEFSEEEKYLFPSNKEYISEADLYGKTKDEIALIRNEIYARHGYVFNTEPFKSYFESKDWYVPNENFDDSVFSEIEKTNKDFLVEYEESRGWR